MATVWVWVAPLSGPPATLAPLIASLTPAEQARAERFRDRRDARRFSVARGRLRHVLATQLDVGPADVQLAEGPGKPRLADETGQRFNLSHAADLALIAVAEREVGVDVEHGESGRQALDAATLACTPAEAAALARLPPGERADAFLCRWTAKEAYLKARGVGLAVAPDRVEVGPVAAGGAALVRVVDELGPPTWWVRELRPAPGYLGAVAAEGRDWHAELRTTADLRVRA